MRNIYYENPINLIYWIVLKSKYKSLEEWYDFVTTADRSSNSLLSNSVIESVIIFLEKYCPPIKKKKERYAKCLRKQEK